MSGRVPRGSGRDRSGIPDDDNGGAPIDDNEEEEDDDDDIPGLIEVPPARIPGSGGPLPLGGGGPPFEITMINGQLGVRMNANMFVMGGGGGGGGLPASEFPPLPGRHPNPLAMIFQSIARGGGGGFGIDGGAGMEDMISQIAAQLFASGEGADEPADESFVSSLKHEPVTEADVAAQKSCSVCLVEFTLEDTSVCKLACSHGFHIDCLKPWLARAHTCPVCRLELRAAQATSSSSDSSGGASSSSGSIHRSEGARNRSNPDRISGRARVRPQPEPRGDPGDDEEDQDVGEEGAGGSRRRSRRSRDSRSGDGQQLDPNDILRMLFSGGGMRPGGMGVSHIRVDEDGFFEEDMEAALQQSMAEASALQARNSEVSGASGASGSSSSSGGGGAAAGGGGAPSSAPPPRTPRDEDEDIGKAFLESLESMTIADIHSICLAEGVTVSPFSSRSSLIEGLASKQGIKLPQGWGSSSGSM